MNWLTAAGEGVKFLWRLVFRDRELSIDGRERDANASRQLFDQQQAIIATLRQQIADMRDEAARASTRNAELPAVLEKLKTEREKLLADLFDVRYKLQIAEYRLGLRPPADGSPS